jgi:hypothetical protein
MFYNRITRSSFGAVVVVLVLLSMMTAAVQAGWQEQFKLLASDGETEDRFGISVGISGNTAIVGAYMFGTSGWGGIGAAYLFDTTTGQQISKLTASDGDNRDQFGTAVAISGSTVIVGAVGDDDYTGSAYVFDVTDPANPIQTHKLVASDRASHDFFGHSGIAISGSIAIIGAHADDDRGFLSGSVYVFDLTSGSQIAKFTASDAAPTAYFGISCAMTGSTAIVGASQGNQGCNSCPIPPGVAYLFDMSDPYHPVETCKLTASDPEGDDQFGISVAIAGNMAVVGARYHDSDGLVDSGSAYLFNVTDIYNPILVRKLTASDPEAYGYFGHSVAMTADTAVVGAVWGDNEGLADCGSVYIFDVTTGEQLGKLTASDGADYDQFGYCVAIDGEIIVAGANLDDDSGSNSGSAYVFVREPEVLAVDADIKPGSCPNPLNVRSKGVLPVAVLGTADFDITTIDLASVRLAGVPPIRSSFEDVATPADGDECECTTAGPDGHIDLSLKFNTEDIVKAIGEVADGKVLELTLMGELLDGTAIEGTDCIVIIAKARK